MRPGNSHAFLSLHLLLPPVLTSLSMNYMIYFIVLLYSYCFHTCVGTRGSAAHVLRTELLVDEVRNYPPQTRDNDSVTIHVQINIKELIGMNVKDESMEVTGWFRLSWDDYRLEWDPAQYSGVREIRITPRDVWVPDMIIPNSLEDFEIAKTDSGIPAVLGYNGLVHWSILRRLVTKCTADVTYFPFDLQTCHIKLNSWTYHDKLVKLAVSNYSAGLETMTGNIEWRIDGMTTQLLKYSDVTNHPLYPGDTIRYEYVLCHIYLKRKPGFYVENIVIPSMLVSWLGSVIFMLPIDCGERLGFSVTLFLAHYVNMLMVTGFLPPSADTYPLIARFFTIISFTLAGSVLLTCLSLTLHHKSIVRPDLLEQKTLLVRLLLLLEVLGKSSIVDFFALLPVRMKMYWRKREVARVRKRESNVVRNSLLNPSADRRRNSEEERRKDSYDVPSAMAQFTEALIMSDVRRTALDTVVENSTAEKSAIEKQLDRIIEMVTIVAADDTKDLMQKRWQYIAEGVDKIILLIYLVVMGWVTAFFARAANHATSLHGA